MPVDGANTVLLPGDVFASWSDATRGDLRPRSAGDGDDGCTPMTGFAADLSQDCGTRIDEVAWITQVHGKAVVVVEGGPTPVDEGGPPRCRYVGTADTLVSAAPGTALCILTADCGALALSSPEGVFAAVHAGWRGLLDGVVEAAVDAMRAMGATDVVGALGPCIHAECYEFAPSDLDVAAEAYGDDVRGRSHDGRPAFDMVAGISTALGRAGADLADGVDICTSCSDRHYSHRARRDIGRQALLVWSGKPVAGS